MKYKLYSFLAGAIISPVFVALIYNVIENYNSPYLTSLSLVFIFGLLSYFNHKVFRQSFWIASLFTILPVMVIDASVLFTYPDLVPLRFPVASLFPLLGAATAMSIFKQKRLFLLISSTCLIIFIYGRYLYPVLLYKKMQKEVGRIHTNPTLFQVPLLTIEGDTIRLSDTISSRLNLVEFFFVGCIPCEQKNTALNQLQKQYNHTMFRVIHICDGEYNTYEKFVSYAEKKNGNEQVYLYAPDSTLRKLYGHELAFPYEQLFTNDKKLISKEIGFNQAFEELYLKSKTNQIETYEKSN